MRECLWVIFSTSQTQEYDKRKLSISAELQPVELDIPQI
jgi:hypothetical protein